ncbi:MAG: hypothetical protein AMXMBFR44_4630 [Candidatus Campbellbacteria bacterium]
MPLLKKHIFLIVALTVFTAGALFFVQKTPYVPEKFLTNEAPTVAEDEVTTVASVEKEVSTATPLQGSFAPSDGELTVFGTILETNKHRALFSLPPLSFNAKLAAAADAKARDMIARQYFEHESPDGIGPDGLADAAGYDYLAVGENLALGNYEDDAELVAAWMDSPGHRENILGTQYTEIGVAVVEGSFEGHRTWFAVQEFGRPASDCPPPDTVLEARIDSSEQTLEETERFLEEMLEEIENTQPKRGSAYNEKVEVYNELVTSYNKLLTETKELIAIYNGQVDEYNECVQ